MKSTVGLILFLLFIFSPVFSQDIFYRIELKDKGKTPYTIEHPEEYLSERAIERRQKQGISIDSTDLPVDPEYFQQIQSTGATIRSHSKWMKTVVVHAPDDHCLSQINQLPFVDNVYAVWKGSLPAMQSKFVVEREDEAMVVRSVNDIDYYGESSDQIAVNNGKPLHQAGYKGKGMWIAVIDASFRNADRISLFNQQQILGYKNFTHITDEFFEITTNNHGTSVLSCMLSNNPGTLVGTAPEAEYFLFMTEVNDDEFPVEEDYWMAAIEYADSLGIDVATTSLGYTTFYDDEMNHTQSQLDGKSILISRAANCAAQKGMLLFIAAGNDGDEDWHYISFPADADDVVCVGAVDKDKNLTKFSGRGPSADGRIKPDAMAMGRLCAVVNAEGMIYRGSGTSYATPIMAGLSTCLWQALPELTNKEIIQLLREHSNYATHPNSDYGYGIPDVYAAYLHKTSGIHSISREQIMYVDSGSRRLYILSDWGNESICHVSLFNNLGQKILHITDASESTDLSFLSSGIYIVALQVGNKRYINKIALNPPTP